MPATAFDRVRALATCCRSHSGPWPLRVLRSSQLDAQRLDAELQTMLHEQFMAVFQLLPQVRFHSGSVAVACCTYGSAPTLKAKHRGPWPDRSSCVQLVAVLQGQVSSLEPELNLLLAALVSGTGSGWDSSQHCTAAAGRRMQRRSGGSPRCPSPSFLAFWGVCWACAGVLVVGVARQGHPRQRADESAVQERASHGAGSSSSSSPGCTRWCSRVSAAAGAYLGKSLCQTD